MSAGILEIPSAARGVARELRIAGTRSDRSGKAAGALRVATFKSFAAYSFPMKRVLILLGWAALAGPAWAANPDPVGEQLPPGWKLLARVAGDLNRDGLDDWVLVAEQTDPGRFKKNSGLGAPVLNLNPRRLLVLLATPAGFKPVLNRDGLLPSANEEDSPCLADPLEEGGGVSIERGNLVIRQQVWLSCGGWGVTQEKFTFRLEASRFRLIGYDVLEFSRNTGEESELSVNYLTGKKKITQGANADGSTQPKVTWEKFSPRRAFFLDEMSLNCHAGGRSADWCR